MRRVFLDTAYLIATFNEDDVNHEQAAKIDRVLAREPIQFVTTHLVFAEFPATLSRRMTLREAAAAFVERIESEPSTSVVPLTDSLFREGLELYRSRRDKRYSLTDCVAMIVCRDGGIREVLTSDRDFAHEGLTVLLR